ncbi:MAG: ABC transporter permease subunit [Bacteroidia bacterium]
MLKLISLEFYKLRNTRYFWILSGLFVVLLIAVPVGVHEFMDYLTSKGENIFDLPVKPNEIPLFDFVDIWQNFTWMYRFFSLFLGYTVIISICNEYSYGTVKQNVIDGLSRVQFLMSKVGFIVALSLTMTLIATLVLLCLGFLWSPVQGMSFITHNIEFMGAYFLHLVGFQLFCMTMAFLIKRSGIVIAIMTFYIYMVESIGAAIIEFALERPFLANLLPVRALGKIIPNPFGKYMLLEAQDYIGWGDLGILLLYIGIFAGLSYWLVNKRDLR